MTKTQSKIFAVLAGTLVVLTVLVFFAFSAYAETDLRGRGTTGRTVDLTPAPAPAPTPVPTPTPIPLPSQSSGSITNTTSGDASSGENAGGHVVTGDENVSVHVVNEGPTNSNTVVTTSSGGVTPPPPAPAPQPECDGRTRTGCTDSAGRTR